MVEKKIFNTAGLRPNDKLISFDGFIGRYDYFTNMIIWYAISLLYIIPYYIYTLLHIEEPYYLFIFDMSKPFANAPLLLKLWAFFWAALCAVIFVSNAARRLNDICGRTYNYIYQAFLMALVQFGIFIPHMGFPLCIANFVILCVLIFKKGKISSAHPSDYLKDFNWGAFFGTWIWGLFNKSYKTLWMLLLWFTPWGLPFALYCGMKGNKWASNNRDWDSLTQFKTSQEKQTVGFVLLYVITITMLPFLIAGIFVTSVVNDNQSQTKLEKIDNSLNKMALMYFEGYKITPDENKFYILTSDWRRYSYTQKKDILDMAARAAVTERRKNDKEGYYSNMTELKRTKIYSSENSELLGEFHLDNTSNSTLKITDIVKAYRFYTPEKK